MPSSPTNGPSTCVPRTTRLDCAWPRPWSSSDRRTVLLERGRLALEASDPAGAERWLRQAVTKSPYDRDARYTLYQCLKRQGKEQEAQGCLSIFERLDADLKSIDRLMRQVQKTPYNP